MAVNLHAPQCYMSQSAYLARLDLIACFINAASATHFARTHAPLIDEDMSMAFDAADLFATTDAHANRDEAHAAGTRYINSFHTTPSGK